MILAVSVPPHHFARLASLECCLSASGCQPRNLRRSSYDTFATSSPLQKNSTSAALPNECTSTRLPPGGRLDGAFHSRLTTRLRIERSRSEPVYLLKRTGRSATPGPIEIPSLSASRPIKELRCGRVSFALFRCSARMQPMQRLRRNAWNCDSYDISSASWSTEAWAARRSNSAWSRPR
ncbi:hypothetical protein B0G81_3851 [Paraburkholderia sp. BL6665CI2N2]|nr:hypothetical protein B0G81_3851 [Paraburkholderia sp. BL6665CI2N2]